MSPGRRRALGWGLAGALLTAPGCTPGPGVPGGGGADPPPALTVLAASSLTGAFEQIGADFERTHPGTSVTFSFGASSTLATQIRSGVPADVFASASAAELAAAVPDAPTPRTFATNVMTIAVPAANPARVTSLTGLADPAVRVALCQPAAPCGRAAAAIFAKAGLVVHPVTEESDAKATLAKVLLGEVDAAVVFATDARAVGDRVASIAIPGELNTPLAYPIAVLPQSRNPTLAAEFAAYVTGEAGQRVLAERGFGPP